MKLGKKTRIFFLKKNNESFFFPFLYNSKLLGFESFFFGIVSIPLSVLSWFPLVGADTLQNHVKFYIFLLLFISRLFLFSYLLFTHFYITNCIKVNKVSRVKYEITKFSWNNFFPIVMTNKGTTHSIKSS